MINMHVSTNEGGLAATYWLPLVIERTKQPLTNLESLFFVSSAARMIVNK